MRNFKILPFLLLIQILTGCVFSAGTLGGFKPVTFPTSKATLDKALDSLFAEYPEYRVPEKWQHFDSWEARGFGYLHGFIFYFENAPEEMYYVTYIGDDKMLADPSKIEIAIRALHNDRKIRWQKEDELTPSERDRIIKRFDSEIVSKLEYYTKVKAKREASNHSEGM